MHRTIPSLFRRAVERAPSDTWLYYEDHTWTFEHALARIERAASGLRTLGVAPGDRVLMPARNDADHLLSWLALMEVGAVQVPINPASTDDEVAGFVHQVRPHLILDSAEVAALFDHEPDGRGPADRQPDDLAVMIPTSGTTGRSKLVMQTHLAYVMGGEGFPWWMQLDAEDRLMTSLPLFHVNAPVYSVLGSVAVGAGLVLLPGFSASTFLDSARRYGATEFNAIGAMLEILMRQPERPDDADTPLRLCYTGPSPPKERHLEIEARFGLRIVCGYGLSESPYALIWRHGERPYGTLGSLRQHPELGEVNEGRVVDETGRVVAPGEVGELELRNPTIMRGYFEMPAETSEVLVDGWLRTGDLVTEDGDGTYTFVSRKKEVIRRRGENLSPAEVEAAIDAHPAVAESAVIGVPDELTEEEVKAFVVLASGAELDVEGLVEHLRSRLSRFKIPRYLEVVDDLPHTPTGRLAKHRLPTGRTPDEIDLTETEPR